MADPTCQDVVELVTDYLEGALDAGATARFEAHLAGCPGCATYLDQIRETVARLGEVHVADLSEEAQAAVLAAFRDVQR